MTITVLIFVSFLVWLAMLWLRNVRVERRRREQAERRRRIDLYLQHAENDLERLMHAALDAMRQAAHEHFAARSQS
jgi:hypothetical protein